MPIKLYNSAKYESIPDLEEDVTPALGKIFKHPVVRIWIFFKMFLIKFAAITTAISLSNTHQM